MQFGAFYGTGFGESPAPTYTMAPMRPATTTPGVVAPSLPSAPPSSGPMLSPTPPITPAPASTAKKFPWALAIGGVAALGVVWWLFKD